MKKLVGVSIALFMFFLTARSQDFYGLSFKTITGDSITLTTYSGQKLMFFVLPLSQDDQGFAQLQSFKSRYLDSVKIIGVLSIEDGYQSSNAPAIQAMYNNMGIVLTEGMYTKKSSGVNQSPVMRWLTNKMGNKHFDADSEGIGHKFFVSQGGRLYAVVPPQASLQSGIIAKIVHSAGQ